MASNLEGTVAVPERTPAALRGLLRGLPDAWTVHVPGHPARICRVMAGRCREEAGPRCAYLPIVAPRR